MKNIKRLVITGLGVLASPGIGIEKFWQGILNKESGLRCIKKEFNEDVIGEYFLHTVDNFHIEDFHLEKDDLDFVSQWRNGIEDKDFNFLLAAIKLALEDSNINAVENNKLSLIVTHENPFLEKLLWSFFNAAVDFQKCAASKELLFSEIYNKVVRSAYETQSFMLLFHLAKIFRINNYSLYVNNACASGLYALEAASDLIRSDKAKQVILVAGDCPDIFKYLWFKNLNMYSSSGKMKPFSRLADGFVLGEGATSIVLEDFDEALKRKAKIYGEYIGGGFNMDSWKITVPAIHENNLQKAVETAIFRSGIRNDDIDLICTHGVATNIADSYESKIIKNLFNSSEIPIAALKPYVGHNLGGSSLLELAMLLLMMNHKMLIPILNLSKNDLFSGFNFITDFTRCDVNIALKMCSAFAGYNSAVIIRKL